ncbi:MAG: preprotein translocase subunit SecA [Candidatus Magasanikbacteria bacterium CG10_big_fil_rev_8_21_14_0_10_36_32]|uniref:Protein translocase subunit SecA n=1 Tax=Candidatus Magasanikbacteria bacterium CG10_big_fil_rev_8_21_14_0_10_36_32 TaxID=1974646 RepID=A0A2M6W5L7_9BACT|nr:MAG: preprotein translocase subunit SecA [Candidatus Magasanikbacteria bacterium CG10_big_fil_rev_8_21_14_0_10_36_32]
MSFLNKIFGDPNIKVIKEIQPIVDKINSLEPEIQKLSLEGLKNKTEEFKDRLIKGESLDDILPEAFAVVRETSKRVTGMRHFDVQLIGGVVLHRGQISEMRTGEGKTLVATLPTYLNALSGKGVHLVTVNDYLAKRDAVWMGQIYDALGLSIGIIQQQLTSYKYSATAKANVGEGSETDKERDVIGMFKIEHDYLLPCSRKEAYQCDITYGTNNEFGFDYLRDNMVQNLDDMSQRELNFTIVDEVDSILIDEARTPLIISAPAEKATDIYYKFAELVERLKENEDYNVDEKMRSATLTDAGIKKMEQWLGVDNIYAEGGVGTVHHVESALRAKVLFKRDRDYVVENGEVIIVDEFTGRKMIGRRYSEGLHQAIEAKEGVEIQRESQTMATVTFQNYFRMYKKISGMTGTAVTEAEEFGKIYNLEVVVIPTNKKICRLDHSDRIYRTEEAKYRAIAKHVKELQDKGQPVLIGTISVDKNEALSLFLEQEGIKHEILNAKNHEREGEIVAQAGRAGAVTLATNMAGRGVDIILGGNPPDKELSEKVKTNGGLFVIGTERHESRRIDNQLRGRAGRQGDPGETQFYLSTEDDLMRIFAGDRIRAVMQTLRVPEDMPIEQKTITRIIESAQKKVEGFHFDTRKHLLDYDDVLNRHREVVYGKRRQILEIYDIEKRLLVEPNAAKPEKSLRQLILDMVEAEIEQVVSFHTNTEDASEWNLKEIGETITTIFPLTNAEKIEITNFGQKSALKLESIEHRTKIIEYLVQLAGQKYEEMLVKATNQPELMVEIEKQLLLRSVDNLWIEHLVAIDYLRTGIGLRGYGQRDPLVEYKKETYRMFNELLNLIQKEVVYSVFKISYGIQMAPSVMQKGNLVLTGAEKEQSPVSSGKIKDAEGKTIGRNDPCLCGSGKKFKKCCGS